MKVEQIYNFTNDVVKEVLGETSVVNEDLSNIIDIGEEVFNANKVDNYVKSLVDHIGRVVFVNRPYSGSVPSVLMDGWEFGSVMQKIQMELPKATENESWELEDGQSYDPNVFTKPVVTAKFFNSKVTFEIPISITEMQVKESFSSVEQLNGFVSMIYNAIDKAMTIRIDELVMRTINAMIGETIHNEYPEADYSTKSGVRAVNLLKLYNDRFTKELTADAALTDKEFIRFASMEMGLVEGRLGKISTLFNIGGKDRFTPSDLLHVVLLNDFKKSAGAYLQSDTFNEEYTALPNAETVPYWQGSGTDYSFSSISKINIKTPSGDTVEVGGILGVMFDRDACAVCNQNRRVTSNYNPKAEFYNNWYKYDCQTLADTNENFVVFFVA